MARGESGVAASVDSVLAVDTDDDDDDDDDDDEVIAVSRGNAPRHNARAMLTLQQERAALLTRAHATFASNYGQRLELPDDVQRLRVASLVADQYERLPDLPDTGAGSPPPPPPPPRRPFAAACR